jgi:hypothetical protein
MVNSACDPTTGAVHAFEEQIGSHGGLGGAQSRPFLLWPVELTPPAPDGEPLTGAEQVHRVLRRWLGEAEGPQLPLGPAADELRRGVHPPEGFPPQGPAAQDKSR